MLVLINWTGRPTVHALPQAKNERCKFIWSFFFNRFILLGQNINPALSNVKIHKYYNPFSYAIYSSSLPTVKKLATRTPVQQVEGQLSLIFLIQKHRKSKALSFKILKGSCKVCKSLARIAFFFLN